MDLYPSSVEYAHWPVTADVDLGTATFEVLIGGAWEAGEWAAAAVYDPDKKFWSRTGRLLVSATTGQPGVHIADTVRPPYRVTVGGEVIVRRSKSTLNVVA